MDSPCPVPTGLTAESAMRTRFTDELREGRVPVHHHPQELAIFQSQ